MALAIEAADASHGMKSSRLQGSQAHSLQMGALVRGALQLTLLGIVAGVADVLPAPVLVSLLTLQLAHLGIECARAMAGGQPLRTWVRQIQLGPISALGFTVVFGLATVAWFLPDMESVTRVGVQDLPGGALVAGAGLYAMSLVYALVRPHVSREATALASVIEGRRAASLGHAPALTVFAASLGAAGLSISSGSWGYLSDPSHALASTSSSGNLISMVSQLGTLAVFLAAWRLGRKPDLWSRALLITMLTVEVALGLFSGMKEQALVPLLAGMLGYGLVRPFRWRRAVAGALFAVFIVVPFIQEYRNVVASGNSRLSPVSALGQVDFTQMLLGGDTQTQSESPAITLGRRLSRIGELSLIVGKTPDTVPYADMNEVLVAPALGVVPRSLWPNKPVLDAGYQVTRNYYGSSSFSSAAVTISGDLWRHGGWMLVIAGMGGWGFLVALFDSRRRCAHCQPQFYFFPLLLVAPLIKQEIDFVSLMATLPANALVAAVGARIASLGPATSCPDPAEPERR